MAVTANGTPTDAWTLIHSATGDTIVSISCDKYNLQVANHDSGTNAPTVKGHPVRIGEVLPVTLKSGDHLWHRIAPTVDVGTADDTPTTVYTIQS